MHFFCGLLAIGFIYGLIKLAEGNKQRGGKR